MTVNFKLFKLCTRIYYNFLLGKINNSIPKLNINISGIELEDRLLIIFPLDEESFRVAAYSFRKLIEYNNSDKYTLLINEDFKNLFYFSSPQIIYAKFNNKKQSLIYNKEYLNNHNFDLVINLNVNEYFQIYKLIGNINSKYKVGIQSLLSNKFYNIQYKVDSNGTTESAYQNIKLLLGRK